MGSPLLVDLELDSISDRNALTRFLDRQGMILDADVEFAAAVMDEGEIVAAGGFAGDVLKGLAVDSSRRDQGLMAWIVGRLKTEERLRDRRRLFIYTQPKNREVFGGLGFVPIATTATTMLMEDRPRAFQEWVRSVDEFASKRDDISETRRTALVLNANPFTLGHRYLVEQAAASSESVFIFVVDEDLSVFPRDLRIRLVRAGTEDLANVRVVPGGPYIISRSTFPTYFLKESRVINREHAALDAEVFASRIAPALGIVRRMVGEEPLCPVTAAYNQALAERLPRSGITFEVVARKESDREPISASRVRRLAAEERYDELQPLVPRHTLEFLASAEAKPILARIRERLR